MKQYLDLLEHIIVNGTDKADRTGVGTPRVVEWGSGIFFPFSFLKDREHRRRGPGNQNRQTQVPPPRMNIPYAPVKSAPPRQIGALAMTVRLNPSVFRLGMLAAQKNQRRGGAKDRRQADQHDHDAQRGGDRWVLPIVVTAHIDAARINNSSTCDSVRPSTPAALFRIGSSRRHVFALAI